MVYLFVVIQIYNKFSGFLLFFTIIYNLSLEMSDEPLLIIDCLHTDDTDGHGGPQAEFVGKQVSINDDRLFTHYIFSAVFIKLRKFLITCPHPCG